MKQDELLIAQLEDKYNQAKDYYMITSGDFLNAHERKVAEKYFISTKIPFGDIYSDSLPGGEVRCLFYGGYPDAERCIPVFVPDYVYIFPGFDDFSDNSDNIKHHSLTPEISDLLKIIRTSLPKHGKMLSHRDYLGSMLALGIDRCKTGDILVRTSEVKRQPPGSATQIASKGRAGSATQIASKGRAGSATQIALPHGAGKTADGSCLPPGADIIVSAEIADFIHLNYGRAGRRTFETEVLDISELFIAKSDARSKTDTLASLRLDSIVASAFGFSRAKAADAIRAGAVSVNGVEVIKPDRIIEEKDKVVFRGHGKAVIASIGGKSRKDRTYVTFDIFG